MTSENLHLFQSSGTKLTDLEVVVMFKSARNFNYYDNIIGRPHLGSVQLLTCGFRAKAVIESWIVPQYRFQNVFGSSSLRVCLAMGGHASVCLVVASSQIPNVSEMKLRCGQFVRVATYRLDRLWVDWRVLQLADNQYGPALGDFLAWHTPQSAYRSSARSTKVCTRIFVYTFPTQNSFYCRR